MPHYVSNQYIDGPFLLRWIIKVSFLKHTYKNKTNIKQKRYNAFNHVIRFFFNEKVKNLFCCNTVEFEICCKCTILISSKSCQISNISIIISKFCFNVFFLNNDCLIFLLSKIHVS